MLEWDYKVLPIRWGQWVVGVEVFRNRPDRTWYVALYLGPLVLDLEIWNRAGE
jgi:hypothetical protein